MPHKPKGDAVSLQDYAKSAPNRVSGLPPWITTIPEWSEIRAAWESGVSKRVISLWLTQEKGYAKSEISEGRLKYLSQIERAL